MYGLDVFPGGRVLVDRSDADRLAARLDPACQLAAASHPRPVPRCSTWTQGITIGDAGTICAVADRAALRTERLPLRVELGGTWSRGRTVVDRRSWDGDMSHDPHGVSPVLVDVGLEVDGPRYARPVARDGRAEPARRRRRRGDGLMGRVVVVGAVYVWVRAHVEALPEAGGTVTAMRALRTVGGRGVTKALLARRAGAEVVMVGAVGDDHDGAWCAAQLVDLGIEARLRRVPGAMTGLAVGAHLPDGWTSTILMPDHSSDVAYLVRDALADLRPDDVVLVDLDNAHDVVGAVVSAADRREARVVLSASPYAPVPVPALEACAPCVRRRARRGRPRRHRRAAPLPVRGLRRGGGRVGRAAGPASGAQPGRSRSWRTSSPARPPTSTASARRWRRRWRTTRSPSRPCAAPCSPSGDGSGR